MFNAIPNDVGPNVAPDAMIALVFPPSTFNMYAMNIPIPIGKMEPKNAIIKPLVPINFNVDRSISIPASNTNKIRLVGRIYDDVCTRWREKRGRERERERDGKGGQLVFDTFEKAKGLANKACCNGFLPSFLPFHPLFFFFFSLL